MHQGIPDTAATRHYITEDILPLCNNIKDTIGPYVKVADGRIMTPTKQASLPLSNAFSRNAKIAYSFSNLQSGSLISIGQLCDDDCVAIFSRYNVKILKNNKVLIRGKRTDNGLWQLPLSADHVIHGTSPQPKEQHVANAVIRLDTTKGELAEYYGDTMFNPVKSTLLHALNRNHFNTWPGMTTKLMRKHLPNRIATAQGHLDQESKNLRSTKETETLQDIAPSQEPNNIKTQDIMCWVEDITDICKTYSDQTGKFPITSSRGHKYIFVVYHFDTNVIYGIAIKSRTSTDLCAAWLQAFTLFKSHGETPNIHILDNECSEDMKTMFREHNIVHQLVPPHIHRRNAAERAIRTYKNHLIAGLYTCDPKFPSREWDQLLPQ